MLYQHILTYVTLMDPSAIDGNKKYQLFDILVGGVEKHQGSYRRPSCANAGSYNLGTQNYYCVSLMHKNISTNM